MGKLHVFCKVDFLYIIFLYIAAANLQYVWGYCVCCFATLCVIKNLNVLFTLYFREYAGRPFSTTVHNVNLTFLFVWQK